MYTMLPIGRSDGARGDYPWDRPKRKSYRLPDGTEDRVDIELDVQILDRLNAAMRPGVTIHSVCAGHPEIPIGNWCTVGSGTRWPHVNICVEAPTAAPMYQLAAGLCGPDTLVEVGPDRSACGRRGDWIWVTYTGTDRAAVPAWWAALTQRCESLFPLPPR